MSTYRTQIEKICIYFIILQPILDLMAFAGLAVSEIVRGFALMAGGLYILLFSKHRIYLLVLAGYLIVNLATNFFLKDSFALMTEVNYIIKTVYFIVILFVFLEIGKRHALLPTIRNLVTINITVITIVMVLAELTGTGQRSYGMLIKEGHTGWFFSGNELSAIMAMGVGFVLLSFLKKGTQAAQISCFLLLAGSGWAMMTIGTKVSFGAWIIVVGAGVVWLGVDSWKKGHYQKKITALVVLLLAAALYMPLSAIGHNLNISYPLFSNSNQQQTVPEEEVEEEPSPVPVKALNGREEFMQATIDQYQQAPIVQKLFGLGYAGNYQNEPKLIEMDFIDLFFAFGMIGFVILLLPLVYTLYHTLIPFRRELLQDINYFMVMIAICLGLGSAALAGHVLSSPAASIYLAIALAIAYSGPAAHKSVISKL
ncbi:O-antigen ligase family protein [Gracilibacillus alcaliphilus]|uniref:O-antigen ligase family protein n=1 Tax=Gracilibacillus alcaliphilus TaxID=1401441 RepID=UPI001958570D|nr:O-antigen ligase family protein [Gracilibacillus alcaliphilus]MBM7678406.1 hypothetical protein [Gracilibacillus alcaliphilus]